MPSRAAIDDFLAEDNLAFVGASRNSKEFANSVYRRLRDGGRTMVPVHRDAVTVEGDTCVATIADVPDPVGGIVIMVPADAMAGVVREAVARGIPRVWLHAVPGSRPCPEEAVDACREAFVVVVDGACPLMFEEPVGGLHRLHRLFVGKRFAA